MPLTLPTMEISYLQGRSRSLHLSQPVFWPLHLVCTTSVSACCTPWGWKGWDQSGGGRALAAWQLLHADRSFTGLVEVLVSLVMVTRIGRTEIDIYLCVFVRVRVRVRVPCACGIDGKAQG